MTQGMTVSNTSSSICEFKSHQEQLEYLQLQYLQKRQQLLQYQTYLTSQLTAQSNQPLKRSQSVQHNSFSSHPSKSNITRQQSANTVADLYYQHQNQIQSPQQLQEQLCPPLPNLPKPPCISLQRRDSVKSDTSQQDTASARYKTELCRPFEETGNCRYGSKCQFAHGAQELRSLNRHPRYKTEFCRTFHTTGFCSYGQRCNFIHNEDERRAAQQQSSTSLPTRPKGLSISSSVTVSAPLRNSTGPLGSVGSLISSSSVSPASSIYGGDMSPIHTPSYLSDDGLSSSRLSPTPSLSSDISFPSPTGSCHLSDDIFEPTQLDYNLSFSLINSLNL